MNLGHNSNVQVGGTNYHVQTEDRGSGHPFIDTTVYCGGRVVHRRTTGYADLLNADGDRQTLLQKRVEEQHRTVIDEIRGGILKLPPLPADSKNIAAISSAGAGAAAAALPESIVVTLLNATSWIQAGHADLHIEVRARETSHPKAGVKILVVLEGATSPTQFEASTNVEGYAEVKFPLPKLGSEGATLVIRASSGSAATDEIRYQLKAKPRTPPAPATVS